MFLKKRFKLNFSYCTSTIKSFFFRIYTMAVAEIPPSAYGNMPLSEPPPGVVPDLIHPQWHGQGVVIAAAIGIPLMLIMAATRIYSKCYLSRKWVLDDSSFIISLVSAISLISLQVALVCEGRAYGYHFWDVTIGDLTKPVLLRSLVLAVGTGPLIWLIKLSLFSLIYNVFHPLAYIRILVVIGLALSAAWYITSAVVTVRFCGPHGGTDRLSYLAGLASSACGDTSGIIPISSIITGIVNIIVDIYLLIIPLAAISHLNLARKRKIGVFFIFLTGAGACVMSILMLYYRTLQFHHSDPYFWKHDTTYHNVSLFTVSTIEYTVGVIIPCMAPSAKIWNHASTHLMSYVRTRFKGFRSMDDSNSMSHEREMKPMARGPEQPSPEMDTIDEMLLHIPSAALRSQN
ncbi:hypothetical protein OCU04_002922 [Sclerotinia nivalis]|uniref:Rhodopsin domain-containing protein n=1 Tax=Sclerotinia nivalis TaxID=352851 RepID=A0A9X0DN21_9HELO|nr:hypothetical protein OCU04_002922 [Sclerotinia nivalis]